MLSLLPDLAPRDSYSLWYTSSREPPAAHDRHQTPADNAHPHANQRRSAQIIDRSPLARLRADEQTLERRMHNVANFGSAWLKPPGIPKTLHQIREEQREQAEHQEAMRREQLAQELAEAEAAGGQDAVIGGPGDPDAVMRDVVGSDADDVQLDGARDLDDDIPEAEADFLSAGADSDEEDSVPSSEDEAEPTGTPAGAARTARLQQQLMTQMMRRNHEQLRESIGGEDEVDDEDQQQMIEEADLIGGDGDDLGMEVDLDDDIPEAESAGGYEHTDTEAELSSSDDDDDEDVSFAAARAPQSVRFRGSLARSDATRNSLAFSDLLSGDGSSLLGSSPQVPRRV